MRAIRETTPYEVLCPRCNVTFPVGTKRCIHCGGRVGPSGGPIPLLVGRPSEAPAEAFPGAEEEEEASPRRSPFSPVAVLWVLLFVGGTIYRACAGG